MIEIHWQDCPECGIPFGVRKTFEDARRSDKRSFFCPNGHSLSYTESEADRLRKALETQKQQNARLADEAREANQRAEDARRATAAQKGVVTRLKNRAAAGVCPCCNRTFVNLQRHMAGKHPGFTATEELAQ